MVKNPREQPNILELLMLPSVHIVTMLCTQVFLTSKVSSAIFCKHSFQFQLSILRPQGCGETMKSIAVFGLKVTSGRSTIFKPEQYEGGLWGYLLLAMVPYLSLLPSIVTSFFALTGSYVMYDPMCGVC